MPQCSAFRVDGKRCKNKVKEPHSYCSTHSKYILDESDNIDDPMFDNLNAEPLHNNPDAAQVINQPVSPEPQHDHSNNTTTTTTHAILDDIVQRFQTLLKDFHSTKSSLEIETTHVIKKELESLSNVRNQIRGISDDICGQHEKRQYPALARAKWLFYRDFVTKPGVLVEIWRREAPGVTPTFKPPVHIVKKYSDMCFTQDLDQSQRDSYIQLALSKSK